MDREKPAAVSPVKATESLVEINHETGEEKRISRVRDLRERFNRNNNNQASGSELLPDRGVMKKHSPERKEETPVNRDRSESAISQISLDAQKALDELNSILADQGNINEYKHILC